MAKKTKKKAIARVPQSREDAVWSIGRIGTLRREIFACKSVQDEAVRVAGERFEAATTDLVAELAEHETGIQTWCEANRMALTADGKVKFHDFGTGQVKWRMRPPKVSIRGADAVIKMIRSLGFKKLFLRESVEINKEAMLAHPDKARAITGVTISSEGEDFVVEPVELESSVVSV